MRTRADDGFNTMTRDGGGETSRASKDSREGLLPMAHIAPKMLVHQWLDVGTDGGQAYHRQLTQPSMSSKHTEKIALRTQQRCLGDITPTRNTP